MFLPFGVKDAIDIFLVAVFLYYVYRLMKMSGAFNLFVGVLTFLGIWVIITQVLELPLIGSILDKVVGVGAIILVILFQDEIRRFLVTIGSHQRWRSFVRIFSIKKAPERKKTDMTAVILACLNMSKTKTGALIVIENGISLEAYKRTGEKINAEIKTRLIENIFFKNSPLHDGAMIIAHGRIDSAGCVLPLSHSSNIPKELGLRHRAALGISQETDAKAIIVSEETGKISTAYQGCLNIGLTPERLEQFLAYTNNSI
ncbi:MAG: diadenylate cyclase CdaA [Candidatus Azobacteroides sp.]|nr:diadenylate cyclase CdaA [Candidatus Azobacteroides sp.]